MGKERGEQQQIRLHRVMSRLLPHDEFAESAVLSSFLSSSQEVGAICAEMGLEGTLFYSGTNGAIFELMAEFWRNGKAVDATTVISGLASRKQLEECGGAIRIAELSTEATAMAVNARHYVEILLEKATLRSVILKAREVEQLAWAKQDDVSAVVTGFVDASASVGRGGRAVVKDMQQHAFEKMERMSKGSVRQPILATGLQMLDRESPISPGSVILVCGLPKSGKSILALCVALNVADNGHRVLYFSLEDPAANLVDRFTANLSKVPILLHQEEDLGTEGNLRRMENALAKMAKLPITIRDDVYELGVMAAVIEQHKAQCPDLALVVVDYAQLVQAQTRKQDSREQEVAKVSRTLRLLSIRLNVAFLVLSQLNDDGKARESRALEQDCTAKWQVEQVEDNRNVRMLDIPFQRNGNSKLRFRLGFQGQHSRFEDYQGSQEEPEPATKKRAK